MSEIKKYKHYFLIIGALLLANYLLVPLSEWQSEAKGSVELLQKQQGKIGQLIEDKDALAEELARTNELIKKADELLFVIPREDQFKLNAQSKIEKALTKSECTIERIGFKGNNKVSDDINRWSMEIRYKGELGCMTKATRALESMTPYVDIVSYNYNHRGFSELLTGSFNAQVQVNVWHKGAK